jgi:L-lactate dehydrogenase
VSRNLETAYAESLDLQHASAMYATAVRISHGSVEDTAGSDVVVVTASVPYGASTASRLDLAKGNAGVFAELIPRVAAYSPGAVLVVVSNPVDVMAWYAVKTSGFPPHRVIGTGTLIDSARLRVLLSEHVGIHPEDIRAYILGEHGTSAFPAWSCAYAGAVPVMRTQATEACFKQAVGVGYEVVKHKGYTNYGIASSTAAVLRAIALDSKQTFPLSTYVDGYLGVKDVCVSLPVVVGRAGVLQQLHPVLNAEEQAAFIKSAAVVRAVCEQIA